MATAIARFRNAVGAYTEPASSLAAPDTTEGLGSCSPADAASSLSDSKSPLVLALALALVLAESLWSSLRWRRCRCEVPCANTIPAKIERPAAYCTAAGRSPKKIAMRTAPAMVYMPFSTIETKALLTPADQAKATVPKSPPKPLITPQPTMPGIRFTHSRSAKVSANNFRSVVAKSTSGMTIVVKTYTVMVQLARMFLSWFCEPSTPMRLPKTPKAQSKPPTPARLAASSIKAATPRPRAESPGRNVDNDDGEGSGVDWLHHQMA
mmetsp:Transcript_116062/g.333332  ORF Transcript_116062/g.333332 Transcript_116062/m.333332 type:complete len:266 (-) Transcript_116062:3-800(-)